jgi:hypothetical protein
MSPLVRHGARTDDADTDAVVSRTGERRSPLAIDLPL